MPTDRHERVCLPEEPLTLYRNVSLINADQLVG